MNNNVSQKDAMEKTSDQWLWFADEELIEALARQDVLDLKSEKRPVLSAALARALALNTQGKTEEALREITAALDAGEILPELIWTKAHLEFQLGQYEAALEDYREMLESAPDNKAGVYNTALCLEKLERFEEALEAFGKAAELNPKLPGPTLTWVCVICIAGMRRRRCRCSNSGCGPALPTIARCTEKRCLSRCPGARKRPCSCTPNCCSPTAPTRNCSPT